MGKNQRNAEGWALSLYRRQLEQSKEHNRRLRQTSESIRSVVSFYSVQNSALREQLCAVEESLHLAMQRLATYEEREYEGQDPLDAVDHEETPRSFERSQSGVYRSPTAPDSLAGSEQLEGTAEAFDRTSETYNDLTLIAGIDEMTAQLLNALGIFSYRQLVGLEADSWDRLATFIPALSSSVERVRWRHEAERLCHVADIADKNTSLTA